MDYLLNDVRGATISTLQEVLDQHTVEGLLKHVVNHQLSELENYLRAKTIELLKAQQVGGPITYDSQYVEIIQETRDQHLHDSFTKKLKAFFRNEYPANPHTLDSYQFRMQGLTDTVAMRKFVDDFSNLAVENCLLEPVMHAFSPSTAENMTDNIVKDIAHEDGDVAAERKRLEYKLEVLENSLSRLQQLDNYSITAPRISYSEDNIPKHEEDKAVSKDDYNNTEANSDQISSPVSVTVPIDAMGNLKPEAITLSLDASDERAALTPFLIFGRKKHRKSLPVE